MAEGGALPTDVFAAAAAEVAQLLDGEIVALVGRFEDDAAVRIVAVHGWICAGSQFPVGALMPLGGGKSVFGPPPSATARTGRRASTASRAPSVRSPSWPAARAASRASVGAPVIVERDVWGLIIDAGWSGGVSPPPDTEARLVQFAELLDTAIANADSRGHLVASRARIVAAEDAARRRIERDLHDGAQQRLVSLALELRAAEAAVPPGLAGLEDELSRLSEGLASAMDELPGDVPRDPPGDPVQGGLGPALKTLARRSADARSGSMCARRAGCRSRSRWRPTTSSRRRCANAAKHAQASAVHVDVEAADGVLRVSVGDDGSGGSGFGARLQDLIGLRDRVEALGGEITVRSPIGAGTSVHVELPLNH